MRSKRLVWIQAAGLYFIFIISFSILKLFRPPSKDSSTVQLFNRHLMSELPPRNCNTPALEQFPKPFIPQPIRIKGAIIIHIIVALYMFIGLSIVCDSYFVPSLEVFSNILKLPDDVAGATFMAAGSSAPELAITIIGVFVTKDDIGVGAVIGSAVFNVMFVISCCGLFVTTFLHLNWWPLCRDCFFYMISIAVLILTIRDGKIYWYEGFITLGLYIVYIAFMFINTRMEKLFTKLFSHINCNKKEKSDGEYEVKEVTNNQKPLELTKEPENGAVLQEKQTDFKINNEEEESPFKFPKVWWKRLFWIIIIPLHAALFITVPKTKANSCKCMFLLTFLMSIIWIAGLSYIMVWMIAIIGFSIGIPDQVMGLTFLAAGISIPDVIASIIVVKEGLGDMAVSNAIGSNVFDILFCLGVPWSIQSLLIGTSNAIEVKSEGLIYCAVTLLSTVALLLLTIHLNKWKLNRRLGVILMIIYILFTVLACLYELNVLGIRNVPECGSNY